jgi:hypothetical protein
MHILEAPSHIFYGAGKVGTQTLNTIEGSCEHHPRDPAERDITRRSVLLRKPAVKMMRHRMLSMGKKQVTCVIREPKGRFISGMYEIIGKQVYGANVVQLARLGAGVDVVQAHIDVMYDPDYWREVTPRAIWLRPNIWEPTAELDAARWQYHIGNWMADVYEVIDAAEKLYLTPHIVDLPDLSAYLNHYKIKHIHRNKFENNMWHMALLDEPYQTVYSKVNHAAIFAAFKAGFDDGDIFHGYLDEELKIYEDLKSKSIQISSLAP